MKGEIYGGRLLLHSAAPGRRRKRGGGKEAKHSLSPSSPSAFTEATQGVGSFVSRGGGRGVFLCTETLHRVEVE